MGKIKPFFITGANAKILLNNKTLAYCTDVSYTVQIIHQTPKVLGMYEGTSVEPLGYNVSGSFQVVRYVRHAVESVSTNVSPNANESGNGAGNWGSVWTGSIGGFAARNGIGNDGRANEALDPSRFSNSTTFDIQIYQKISKPFIKNGDLNRDISTILGTVADIAGGANPKRIGHNLIGVANIRNCRITQADFSLNKKGIATQRFNFVALYVDEDSFAADFSGTAGHNI
jgi:hypothetical protein